MNTKLMFSSANIEWETPDDLFAELRQEFALELDVCASDLNAKLAAHWTAKDNCLVLTPGTRRCWMNPPYGEPEKKCRPVCKKKRCVARGFHITEDVPGCIDFVRWAFEETKKGATFVCLLPARTDTAWYHLYCKRHTRRFLRGRLKFSAVMPDGSIVDNPAPFPSMVVIMRPPRLSQYEWDEQRATVA